MGAVRELVPNHGRRIEPKSAHRVNLSIDCGKAAGPATDWRFRIASFGETCGEWDKLGNFLRFSPPILTRNTSTFLGRPRRYNRYKRQVRANLARSPRDCRSAFPGRRA